jgi:two-component system cell cycle sensor histidine kinase/response regulator CckA
VSDGVEEPSGLALVRYTPGLQPALLFVVGLAVAGAAAIASAPGVTFVFAAMAGGLFGAAALVYARGLLQGTRRRRGFERMLALIRHDPAPSFITLDTGEIAAQNLAAEQRFGQRRGQPMARALASLLPNAAAVVFRHETAVEHNGAVQEAIMTPRGPVRLVAHALDGGVLWRLDEADEALNSGQRIGLPMMVVSHADTVLSMNDAMRRLLGRSVEALAEAFPERPLVPGRRTRMMASDGTLEVVPVILSSQDGRREIYAVPGLAEPPAASVAARAFEALPVALLHLGSEGEVLASNRQAQVLLGISANERGHLSSLVDGPGRPVRDWVAESLKGSATKRTEVVRARKRQDECFLQIALSRITDDTGPSLLAVLHDATELKTLEQQFVQSQKMQAVGELAGGVAHDFNNILTAITGHCDLLLLRHDHGDEDYGDLIQINQNANRAAALVGQLLAFSRQQTLQPEVIDLRDTIGELIHLLNRLLGEKITLVTRHDQGLLPVRVDRRQLDQVIMNLVVNARDAMPDGGEIRVETRTVHLREPLRRDNAVVPVGHYVTIRVRDDGVGIPPDRLSRIFEPFFTTKEVGKGTGLGLSMAYGIVKQTGGFIFVDSVVDAGTTFTDKQKALDSALGPDRTAVRQGLDHEARRRQPDADIEATSTGSLGLDIALGIGGLPKGRIIEIYGPESSGKTTLTLHVVAEEQKKGGVCAFVDAEHALDPQYARKLGVDLDELLISQPDTGEQALEITDTLVRSGAVRHGRGRFGRGADAEGRARRRHGRQLGRRAGAADEPGDAQADRLDQRARTAW